MQLSLFLDPALRLRITLCLLWLLPRNLPNPHRVITRSSSLEMTRTPHLPKLPYRQKRKMPRIGQCLPREPQGTTTSRLACSEKMKRRRSPKSGTKTTPRSTPISNSGRHLSKRGNRSQVVPGRPNTCLSGTLKTSRPRKSRAREFEVKMYAISDGVMMKLIKQEVHHNILAL